MTTAESLLAPFNWPQVLHPSTRNREDYSVFCLSPWCLKPTDVPRRRDLQVVEPPIGEILSPPGKPSLIYLVSISVKEALHDATSGGDSDSSFGGDNAGHQHRRQRRGPSPFAGDQVEESTTTTSPARDTLGPTDSGACHMACSVEAARSLSQATALEPPLMMARSQALWTRLARSPHQRPRGSHRVPRCFVKT